MIKTSILMIGLMLPLSSFYSQSKLDKNFPNNDTSSESKNIIKVFNGGFFTEGPAVSSKGEVYFTDLTFISETGNIPGHIWKYSPTTKETKIYRSPSGMANGMLIDEEDNLYICEGADKGGRRIIKTDLNSGKSVILADKYEGKLFNSPNDLTRLDDGTIYFTDPRFVGDEAIEQPVMGVYRIRNNGSVEMVIDNISMPNGIAVSPDEKYLFVGSYDENFTKNEFSRKLNGNFIAKYLINNDGSVRFNKIIVEFENGVGPDGILVDDNGNLFVAVRNESNPHVGIYNSAGIQTGIINIPEVPSNLCFDNLCDIPTIYVTAGGNLYKIKLTDLDID